MAKHIWAGVADTPQMIIDAQRVRNRVFVMEKGLLSHSSTVLGREVDAYDDLASTTHFIVYADGAPAATVRLLRPDPAVARTIGQPMGIDLASRYDLDPLDVAGVSLAEVSRMCVLPEHRGTDVLCELYLAMYRESLRAGLSHWVAAANTETDSIEDAMIVYGLLQREGLVSKPWRVSPRIGASAQGRRAGRSTRPSSVPGPARAISLACGCRGRSGPSPTSRRATWGRPSGRRTTRSARCRSSSTSPTWCAPRRSCGTGGMPARRDHRRRCLPPK